MRCCPPDVLSETKPLRMAPFLSTLITPSEVACRDSPMAPIAAPFMTSTMLSTYRDPRHPIPLTMDLDESLSLTLFCQRLASCPSFASRGFRSFNMCRTRKRLRQKSSVSSTFDELFLCRTCREYRLASIATVGN